MFKRYINKTNCIYNEIENNWRKGNNEYIESIGKFLDIVDNINDENLKKRIIYQHFCCERVIQNILKKSK